MRSTRSQAATDVLAVIAAILLGWLLTLALYPALGLPDNVPKLLRPLMGFLCAWLLIHYRGDTLRSLGLRATPVGRVLLLAALLIVLLEIFERYAVPPLAGWIGLTPQTPYLAVVRGDTGAFLLWLVVAWVIGGFCEECLFRGFFIKRIADALGAGPPAIAVALLGQALIFGCLHLYAGLFMAVLSGCFSLIFGLFYLASGRQLWPLIVAHGAWNTLGLWAIYSS